MIPCKFQGVVSISGTTPFYPIMGVGMSRGFRTHPPADMAPQGGEYLTPRHGVQQDLVSKQAVSILLECFLVQTVNIDTMLNNNGSLLNNGLKIGTCKQGLKATCERDTASTAQDILILESQFHVHF